MTTKQVTTRELTRNFKAIKEELYSSEVDQVVLPQERGMQIVIKKTKTKDYDKTGKGAAEYLRKLNKSYQIKRPDLFNNWPKRDFKV